MVDLSTIPLVMSLATWIWGAESSADVSPEICVSQLPFLSSECLSQLISKGLGILIILASCVNKVPLILNMMNSKSAAGISRSSLYAESLTYASCVFYGLLFAYPFSTCKLSFHRLISVIYNLTLSDMTPIFTLKMVKMCPF